MTVVLVPLVLLGPAMALAAALLALASRGPLGVVAAVLLGTAVLLASRWSWRRARTWWASTKAPERDVTHRVRAEPGG